jgi:hypothetical protein
MSLVCYLRWDRHSAMADFILRTYGFECPISFVVPTVLELPPVKWSVCDWPARIVVERENDHEPLLAASSSFLMRSCIASTCI